MLMRPNPVDFALLSVSQIESHRRAKLAPSWADSHGGFLNAAYEEL
jgi:hypothetical protein